MSDPTRQRPHVDATPPKPPTPSRPNPTLQVDERGVGWITFDDPDRKLNVLTEAVMRRLADLIKEAERLVGAGQMRALVMWSGKDDGFIAGADVEAIAAVNDVARGESASRLGQSIFTELEHIEIPTVAAIHGICLGGGTELSLACRFRVVSDSPKTRIGLPEVQLGILPAWGGTTRLPRLVGLQAALPILLTGEPVSASKARRIGLVDEVLPAQGFRDLVGQLARALADGVRPRRAKRGVLKRVFEDTPPGRALILAAAKRSVRPKSGGHYPAPFKILDVLGDGLGAPLQKAFQIESAAAGQLITSDVSKSLIHVFHLREAAKKSPVAGVRGRTVDTAAVLGAGVMGGGIAQLLAYKGIRVRMKDVRHEAVQGGLKHARELFDDAVARRKLTEREADQRMELISGGLEYHGLAESDLVIEAVVEKLEVKRQVLREVESKVRPDCVLATNTSSLSVDAMAEALERPQELVGMHFFNPVHRMPLVEVVRGARSSDDAVATVYRLALDLGKVPVVVGDGAGFVVNRILGPYLNEAGWLLGDGATIEQIDAAARSFGMPMGPIRLLDEVGLDIARHAASTLHQAFGERMLPSPPLQALSGTDRLGKKNGKGFYSYEQGKEKGVDESVYQDLGGAKPGEGGPSPDEIRKRLMLVMVNEAARILSDRIVKRAGDVDLAMIMGTGFPPFRGGLLRFADSLGTGKVAADLGDLAARVGPRFEPAPILTELAAKGRGFYDVFGG
ncbi:MAG: fatty oxidation complex subunit alpha [Gemmatimonadetes bacterium]|nr:fatty oxidation complex subunit alpha [Gemmatimonadota bacterium]